MDKNKKGKIGSIAGLVIAVVYLILPMDLLPDAMPIAGWIDDLIAILLAVSNAIRVARKNRDQ